MGTLKRVEALDPNNPAVLFVDDEPHALASCVALFRRDPILALCAASGLHALEILKTEKVAVVVSDYWMTGMSGVKLLDEVARLYPEVGRILLTGMPDSELVLEAKGHKVLTKGMDVGLIRRVILREVQAHGG
jgi:DNA-binding NtrC family response regulator